MHIDALLDKRIGLLGFGREGQATKAWLQAQGLQSRLSIFLDETQDDIVGCDIYVGEQALTALGDVDVLIRSPGFAPSHKLRQAADALGVMQTSATCIFIEELQRADLPVIGITGSKGKSTTCMLAYLMLQEAQLPCRLVGNIGEPALANLQSILSQRAITVMELSSYQCADLQPGVGPSHVAVLDLFAEHLDWHGDVQRYFSDKLRLLESKRPKGRSWVANQALSKLAIDQLYDISEPLLHTDLGFHFSGGQFFEGDEAFADDGNMLLLGAHNRNNAVSAYAIVKEFGVTAGHFKQVIKQFSGLDYRLQNEGRWSGIDWVNDSLATTPETTIAALSALPKTHTLIMGGFDRGYDYSPLADYINRHPLQLLLLLPDTGWSLANAINDATHVQCVDNLEQAVMIAVKKTPQSSTCLMSPGAPSYNQYTSFVERGQHFRRLIKQ